MWKPVTRPNIGALGSIQDILEELATQRPDVFPDFSDDRTLLCASDYSGQHAAATHEVYSFVFTSLRRWHYWERERVALRGRHLLSRTISFKSLNDVKRRRALPDFLAAASRLEAITITVAVNKRLGSVFSKTGRLDRSTADVLPLAGWKDSTVERLLRILHFSNLFVAGLSTAGQDLLWISDEDEIVSNEERHRLATKLSGNILSNLLDHDLGHIRFGTTASDDGSLQLEDFVAIADFTCGAVSEALTDLERDSKTASRHVVTPFSGRISPKSAWLLQWLSNQNGSNSQVVISLDGLPNEPLSIRRLSFEAVPRLPVP
jgi:hypothetical protein